MYVCACVCVHLRVCALHMCVCVGVHALFICTGLACCDAHTQLMEIPVLLRISGSINNEVLTMYVYKAEVKPQDGEVANMRGMRG